MDMTGLSPLELAHGKIHLYTGDGKGKTTAAAGLAARMLGSGGTVLFAQFLKGRPSGEVKALEALGGVVRRIQAGSKFVFQMNEEELAAAARVHREGFAEIVREAVSGRYRLIVLDEVVDAVNCGLVELEALLELLGQRPEGTEIVLTGRNPDPALVERADYHTDFLCRKHPYEQGLAARKGIEY